MTLVELSTTHNETPSLAGTVAERLRQSSSNVGTGQYLLPLSLSHPKQGRMDLAMTNIDYSPYVAFDGSSLAPTSSRHNISLLRTVRSFAAHT